MFRWTVEKAMTAVPEVAADAGLMRKLEERRTAGLAPEQSLEEALEQFGRAQAGLLPVVRDGAIVGGLTRAHVRSYSAFESTLGVSLDRVEDRISPRDRMFDWNLTEYLKVGASALQCIRCALARTRTPHVSRILDFGCGHGRVLRMLRAAFPDASFTTCDLDLDAVRFSAETFGATPVVSSLRFADVEIAGEFDLIWAGSLLTHLNEDGWRQALLLLATNLAPRGTLVFSTHGRPTAERLRDGDRSYDLSQAGIEHLLKGYEETGFGHADYEDRPDYGIAVCSPEWVAAAVARCTDLEVVAHEGAAWAGHEDVVVCAHPSPAMG
jgi:SAM-dependent methyltransferase